jgi:predicted RNase H-like nuclease
LRKVLAAAAAAFAVLHRVKESFQNVVGAIDQPDAFAQLAGKRNGVAPKKLSVTFENALSTLAPMG